MNHSINRREFALFGISLVASALLTVIWFSPLNFHVLIGDDLFWIKYYKSGEWSGSFLESALTIGNTVGKFRPLSNALTLFSADVCQSDYDCFVSLNYVIFTLNAILMSVCAYKITDKWAPGIFIPAIIFILSRFSYYSVLQVMGIMENLGMTFTLLLLFSLIGYMRTAGVGWIILTILAFLCAALTHERFIVLAVPVFFALVFKKRTIKLSGFVLSFFGLGLAIAGYFTLRHYYVIPSTFLTGTGGSSVKDTFQLSQVAFFMGQGVLNLVGFNAGPAYLSGKYYLSAGKGGILVGVLLSGSLAALVCALIYERLVLRYENLGQDKNTQAKSGKNNTFSVVTFFEKYFPRNIETDKTVHPSNLEIGLMTILVLTIGVLLLASSITIRQEYRWLYTPFAAFILLVFYLLSRAASPTIKYSLALLIFFSFIGIDLYYRPSILNVFFMDGLRTANSVKSEIIDKHSARELSEKEVFIITGGNDVIKSWYLADDYFFKLYAPDTAMKVYYINDLMEIPASAGKGVLPLLFNIQDAQTTAVSRDVIQKIMSDKTIASNYHTEYDFILNFSSGVLNDNSVVSTPTGLGAFLMYWRDNLGLSNSTITLVSQYSIRFPSITCKEGSRLIFRAGMPYVSSDGADLYIDLYSHGATRRILNAFLKPAEKDGVITWVDYNIPIDQCAAEPIEITFGVSSNSGNPAADWVALTNHKIVTSN